MTTKNLSLIFKKVPTEWPVPGEHLIVEDRPIDLSAPLPKNAILMENLHASIDPYMRGRMRPAHVKSYSPAFDLNEPVTSVAVARVIKSTSTEFAEGELVIGVMAVQQYVVRPLAGNDQIVITYRLKKLPNPHGLTDLRLFLGAVGMPGLTAYSSLYEIGKPKKGETIFVSSAAGPVGQLVGQLAKREGLKVIGSVGSDEKLEFITKELKFDGGFNYKKEHAQDALKRLAPDGIDIYFENVGGEQLEAAINAMNNFGRIIACGMISEYSTPPEERYPLRNLFLFISKRITMRGFIVSDENMGLLYYDEFIDRVGKWLKDGSLIAKTDEMGTIESGDKAVVSMLQGKNFGKACLKMKL